MNGVSSNPIKVAAAYWQQKITGEEVDEKEMSNAEAIGTVLGVGIVGPYVVGLLSIAGCGVEEKTIKRAPVGDIDPNNINITGDPVEILIDAFGDRIQANGEMDTITVGWGFSGAKNKTVKVIIESVPEAIHPDLVGLDGVIDKTPIAERPGAVNIGTEDNPIWIKDPHDPNNRLPVFLGTFTITDLTGKIEEQTIEVCSPEQISEEACGESTRIGATDCPDHQNCSPNIIPYVITIPLAAYANNEGQIQVSFTPRINISNYDPDPQRQYDYQLIVRLVIEDRIE